MLVLISTNNTNMYIQKVLERVDAREESAKLERDQRELERDKRDADVC